MNYIINNINNIDYINNINNINNIDNIDYIDNINNINNINNNDNNDNNIDNNIIYIKDNFNINNTYNINNRINIKYNLKNIQNYKDYINTAFKNIKFNYKELIDDINKIYEMLNDIKEYNINNIINTLEEHLLNLENCLKKLSIQFNFIQNSFINDLIYLNKKTNMLLNKNKKKSKCFCPLF